MRENGTESSTNIVYLGAVFLNVLFFSGFLRSCSTWLKESPPTRVHLGALKRGVANLHMLMELGCMYLGSDITLGFLDLKF